MLKNSEWGATIYFQGVILPDVEYEIKEMSTGDEYVSIYQRLIGGAVNYIVRKNGIALVTGLVNDSDMVKLSKPFDSIADNYERYSDYLGSAVTEISSIDGTTITSVGGFTVTIPQGATPFMKRTGESGLGFSASDGAASSSTGFRTVIIVK
jgi:hypothetical protein